MNYGYSLRKQGIIVSSRGCPFQCIYCHSHLGKTFRGRSPENIFQEIRYLYDNFDIRDFCFIDDNFAMEIKRAEDTLDLIIQWGKKIRLYFSNGIRADMATERLIDKMIRAGAVWIVFAIETASPRLQKYICKNLNLEKARHIINYTFDKGASVMYCMMFGFPTETYDESRMTIDFAKTLRPSVAPAFFAVKYYRGTKLYQMAQELNYDMEKINRSTNIYYHDIRHIHAPSISRHDMRKLYLEYVNDVFLDNNRLKTALERHRENFTDKEILKAYHLFLGKAFTSIDDILSFSRA